MKKYLMFQKNHFLTCKLFLGKPKLFNPKKEMLQYLTREYEKCHEVK